MQRQTPLDTSLTGFVAGGARGCVHKADDKPLMQEITVNFTKGEWRDQVEHPQNYGFTSFVREAVYDKDNQIDRCAEHFTWFMTGNRAFPVTGALDDRRYRLLNMEEGEAAVYDDQQQSIKLKRKEIQTRSQKRITLRLIKDEDQHKEDAERDQQKHKDKPLSSMMFDKDTIEIVRTKDDGQLAAKSKEEDKPGTMLSRVFLTKGDEKDKDKIIIETPSLHQTIDEKNKTYIVRVPSGKIVSETETLSITIEETSGVKQITSKSETLSTVIDESDGVKKITSKSETLSITIDEINKTIRLKSANLGVTLHENSKWVVIGDGVQGYQAARIGSLTARGDVIVGRVATKVLVL